MKKDIKFERRYILIFPDIILNDPDLSWHERSVFALILSMDNGEDGCYATNRFCASFFKTTTATISRTVSKLFKKGYLVENSSRSGWSNTRRVRGDFKKYKL